MTLTLFNGRLGVATGTRVRRVPPHIRDIESGLTFDTFSKVADRSQTHKRDAG